MNDKQKILFDKFLHSADIKLLEAYMKFIEETRIIPSERKHILEGKERCRFGDEILAVFEDGTSGVFLKEELIEMGFKADSISQCTRGYSKTHRGTKFYYLSDLGK